MDTRRSTFDSWYAEWGVHVVEWHAVQLRDRVELLGTSDCSSYITL